MEENKDRLATELEKKKEEKYEEDQEEQEAEELCENTLRTDAHISVNKKLIKEFGLSGAVLLADLLSKKRYFKDKGKLEGGWFYNTEDNIEKDTGVCSFSQRKDIKLLEKLKVLSIKYQGLPRRKYFKINHAILQKILSRK